jgi:very-short-patch-repair endonuclease
MNSNPTARTNARRLRREMSLPEVMLWRILRQRQTGFRFRRQHPIGLWVVDFYCPEAKLAVEIDGISHDMGNRPDRDVRRDMKISEQGVEVVRFPASAVLKNVVAAAEAIAALCRERVRPLHQPAAGPPPHAAHGEDCPS